ncbi:MAG: hypothetical protein A2284_15500 [Deltaproteobacteria bacterium RIFOXYA12_FULL_61_11]|nr:MAG: hypothetical protein A2284_15500 [Deltaproteobacteria bacterium RIFOXYA12_FULL_61_11]
MRLLLLLPDGRIHCLRFARWAISFREAPLTHTLLAALVPEELGFEVEVADESIGPIPLNRPFDLVGISVITGASERAYELADHYRSRGATVVLGGVHVTLRPDEAAAHADAIVLGFAERTWPALLRDFATGRMAPRYQDDQPLPAKLPKPRRELQRRLGYMAPTVFFATRGCRSRCDFCSVPAAGQTWQTRPVGEVIDEIRASGARRIVFNDVHLNEDPEYAKELLEALVPLRITWGGLASTRVVRDEELLALLGRSGCNYLLLGFESLSQGSLQAIQKGANKVEEYREVVRLLHQQGIILQGCFIFGIDEDEPEVFERTVAFVDEVRIDIPRYAIYTPYPGTEAFHRLLTEGRLLHQRWRYYDTQHVVFRPARMTPEQLDQGFLWAYRTTFTLRSILRRTLGSGGRFPITFMGNLAYRLYVGRLEREAERIPSELGLVPVPEDNVGLSA